MRFRLFVLSFLLVIGVQSFAPVQAAIFSQVCREVMGWWTFMQKLRVNSARGRDFLIQHDFISARLESIDSGLMFSYSGGDPVILSASPELKSKLAAWVGHTFVLQVDPKAETLNPWLPLKIKRFWPAQSEYHWQLYSEGFPFYESKERGGGFTNFAAYPIWMDGKLWPTVEHYFQAMKFKGTPREEQIRLAKSAKEAAVMGRDPSFAVRVDWEEVKEEVMRVALAAKFDQHPLLKRDLLATSDRRLVEHSPKDAYWGDGWDGSGKNRLGTLLMELRAELREMSITESSRGRVRR